MLNSQHFLHNLGSNYILLQLRNFEAQSMACINLLVPHSFLDLWLLLTSESSDHIIWAWPSILPVFNHQGARKYLSYVEKSLQIPYCENINHNTLSSSTNSTCNIYLLADIVWIHQSKLAHVRGSYHYTY